MTRHNLLLAPLAGISDYPFRQLCRDFGADLTFTEMVSVDGLLYENQATRRLLTVYPGDRPLGFQFFGSDSRYFREVLPRVEALRPDVIDLNFGCPVRKVVARGAGAALLKELNRLGEIVETVARETDLPVTAKIRIGWDADSIVAVDAARTAEEAGARAVTVHGRTRSQGYSGRARWEQIARVKEALKIPVIGNGDVFDAASAAEMFRTTGVDGIMLARGALGRPWIFSEILQELTGGEPFAAPDVRERMNILRKHYELEVTLYGEETALSRMKKHFVWYTKGLPHTARLRDTIFRAKSFAAVKGIFDEYLDQMDRPRRRNATAKEMDGK